MQVDVEEEEGRKMMRREVLVWRLSALGPSGSSLLGLATRLDGIRQSLGTRVAAA